MNSGAPPGPLHPYCPPGQSPRFKIKKPAASYFPAFSSIIGAEVLDFRVRNGNGYCHLAMATGIHYYAFASRIRASSRAPLSFMYSLLMEYKSLSSR